jgi:uncharacterized protein with PQ loop repeat
MRKHRKIKSRIIDKNHDGVDDRLYIFTEICAIVLPFTTLDQLYIIYVQKKVEGVSLLTWFLYGILSIPLFLYSIQKRDRPMIILNGLWVFIDFTVWLGVFMYR